MLESIELPVPNGVVVIPDPQVVVVWCRPLPAARLAGAIGLVDPVDRQRLARFRNQRDRLATLTSRVLLRHAGDIARAHGFAADGPPFLLIESEVAQGRGKPAVNHDGWQASVSHDTVVITALSRVGIGVDTQGLASAPTVGEVAAIFTGGEQQWLVSNPGASPAIRLWTAKEALLKAKGTGFFSDPRLPENNTLASGQAQLATWRPEPDAIACLALLQSRPVCWPSDWEPFPAS